MAWYDNAVFYHIYPLGYTGAPKQNDFSSTPVNRIKHIIPHIPVLVKQGYTAIYFGPVFSSSCHGYDTADYSKIDERLGTNDDFAELARVCRDNGIKIVLDGVFNHVGRDFWAFKDVREHKFNSRYKDWFVLRDGNSNYNDGFWYEGWEGHFELVKLNLFNPEVKEHIKNIITDWVKRFDIDGIRLDVAYCLDLNFLKELHNHVKSLKDDFWLMGETLHGDYRKWCNNEMCDSVTNYQSYKGLWSSFNDFNMFEIAHSFARQFGSENWNECRNLKLYSFLDNHDVSRISSVLKTKEHIFPIYALLFTAPGIPSVYYGSEYELTGNKANGDDVLRPEFRIADYKNQIDGKLPKYITRLAYAHFCIRPLYNGNYKQVYLTNKQYCFSRTIDGETAYIFINADSSQANFPSVGNSKYVDILTEEEQNLSGSITVKAYSAKILVAKNSDYDNFIDKLNTDKFINTETIISANTTANWDFSSDTANVADTVSYFDENTEPNKGALAESIGEAAITKQQETEIINDFINGHNFRYALKEVISKIVKEAVSAAISREYANINETVWSEISDELDKFTGVSEK